MTMNQRASPWALVSVGIAYPFFVLFSPLQDSAAPPSAVPATTKRGCRAAGRFAFNLYSGVEGGGGRPLLKACSWEDLRLAF